MKLMFEGLSEPFAVVDNDISVLCIENKLLLQKVINEILCDCTNEYMLFSQNNKPLKYKNECLTVFNYFNLEYSSSFIKKLYADISNLMNTEMSQQLSSLHSNILDVLYQINTVYDFDLSYNCDFDVTALLKMQSLVPEFSGDTMLERLIDYLSIISKYDAKKCYVLLLISNYFSELEISELRDFVSLNKLRVLIVDLNSNVYEGLSVSMTIIDKDLCEIVETT